MREKYSLLAVKVSFRTTHRVGLNQFTGIENSSVMWSLKRIGCIHDKYVVSIDVIKQ